MKVDDDTDIVVYSREQVEALDSYFKGTNAETAYLLGRYCGLRINECYGLKWGNIDLERGTITIDRQMQYQEGLIKLVSLKTRNARRTVYMAPQLKEYLLSLVQERSAAADLYAAQREQNQTFMHILCNQMGHASGKVTERYYLAVSQAGIDILTKNLSEM